MNTRNIIIVFYLNTCQGGLIDFFFLFRFKEEAFAERLKELRTSRGLTLEALAKKVNATKAAIGNFENGNKKPSLDALVALADYFEVSLDYLTGRTDCPRILVLHDGKPVIVDQIVRLDEKDIGTENEES